MQGGLTTVVDAGLHKRKPDQNRTLKKLLAYRTN